MARKQKKKRTHIVTPPDTSIPRSFVIKSGDASSNTAQLVRDFRRIMEPNTASNLKERKGNKIKDFLMVAGQLMVSHLIVFTSSSSGRINLRIGKIPRGPTITFHVQDFSLVKDVLAVQKKPRTPNNEYLHAPLVVLNNFANKEKHITLLATVLQNMFPAIKVSKLKISEAKRILLFNYNEESKLIEMRHYLITTKQLGISRSIKQITSSKVPDLQGYDDISDFVIKGAFAAESDIEDEEAQVSLPKAEQADKRAIRLYEQGPRLNLKLLKIEDGLCGGEIIYHSYIKKTQQEITELKNRKNNERAEKAKRKAEQEKNVQAKKQKLQNNENNADAVEEKEESEEEYGESDFEDLLEKDFNDNDDAASDGE